ncbi:MarR family winged helix-turn-helix transcriptional regulator [Geobacter sp. SVR]|uniref:MarR family winged helix-turn-helix transcriptional regulator n=1 Tax=Geobacter sp. SVR TaxID=2495594 RepID=UPI00143EFC80|nr:MarR family transcriptional regulator [Geobacter sp. SVR]BCS52517.1 MarR family transcriptional regulator [Geobacter sp. SVR]GCF84046.1 MarR family transcriptional regulator [Geobacter sp. SVR]
MESTPALVSDIVDSLRRMFQVINEQSKKAEHETGLTGPQLWAIKVIAESAPIKVSDLARKMYLHPATVVGIIDRLETRELVERRRSKEDRRVVEIALTDNGREKVSKSPEVAQGLLVKGLEALSEQKLKNISDGLEQLVEILGAQEIPPQLMLSCEVNLPQKNIKTE